VHVADKASLLKKLIYASNHGRKHKPALSGEENQTQRNLEASQEPGGRYADICIRDLDHSDDAHLRTLQAPCSPCCQAPANRSKHHAHKIITSSSMEAHSKDTDTKHHAVKGDWK